MLILSIVVDVAKYLFQVYTIDASRIFVHLLTAAIGRFCCKSLFALVTKNSPGCRCGFRVKMWGTSSPGRKITGDLGNLIEAIQIGGRGSNRFTAGKLS